MGKPMLPKPSPGVYRDDLDRDDAASTSSAVLMDDIDYPDSDLPAYEDVPTVPTSSRPTPAQLQEPQSYAGFLTLNLFCVSAEYVSQDTLSTLPSQPHMFRGMKPQQRLTGRSTARTPSSSQQCLKTKQNTLLHSQLGL